MDIVGTVANHWYYDQQNNIRETKSNEGRPRSTQLSSNIMTPMTPPNNGNAPPPRPSSSATTARPSKLVVTPGILHMGEEGMYDAPISADSIGAPSQKKTTKSKAILFAVMKKEKRVVRHGGGAYEYVRSLDLS